MKEIEVSQAIISEFSKKLLGRLENDVVIAGSGPAGLTAAYYLAKAGIKTTVVEKRLSTGGGIWGGAAGFNEIVVEDNEILNELEITTRKKGNLYLADAIEFATGLCYKAKKAGAVIFNLLEVEDIVVKKKGVEGVVVNNTAIMMAKLAVDPFCINAKYVIDATGHPAEIVNMLKKKKADFHIDQIGEGFMDIETSEAGVVEKTGKVWDGLYVTGMSVCAVHGLPRMGPIFGGMLKSGKKVAEMIIAQARN